MPILVPIFDLSLVKATTMTGGRAMKTPEKKPKKAVRTTRPAALVTARKQKRTMPTMTTP